MGAAHFLTLKDLDTSQVSDLINRALQLKDLRKKGERPPLFQNKTLAMIFEKSSTRTRVSFLKMSSKLFLYFSLLGRDLPSQLPGILF